MAGRPQGNIAAVLSWIPLCKVSHALSEEPHFGVVMWHTTRLGIRRPRSDSTVRSFRLLCTLAAVSSANWSLVYVSVVCTVFTVPLACLFHFQRNVSADVLTCSGLLVCNVVTLCSRGNQFESRGKTSSQTEWQFSSPKNNRVGIWSKTQLLPSTPLSHYS